MKQALKQIFTGAIVGVGLCQAQPPPSAAEAKAAMDAEFNARPSQKDEFPELWWMSFPTNTPPVAPGVVSVYRLRHKIPPKAEKAFLRAADLSAARDYSAAARELERALALDPAFAEAHANLGVQYLRLGRIHDAEAHMRRAVELDPASSTAHSNLAAVQLDLGDRVSAEANARRAVAISSTNAKARAVLDRLKAQ